MDDAPDAHILNRFTKAVIENIGQSMSTIDPADFETACSLLSDRKRRVFVVGGRITRTLADYFFLHMQVIRDDVIHIASNSNAWPHYILNLEPDDVVVIFDISRYENSTLRLAEMASERAELRPKERQALHYRFHAGMTQREIGEEIGVSQMQVSRLLRSALGKLLVAVRGDEELDPAVIVAEPVTEPSANRRAA